MKTYWNGKPCNVKKVKIIVGKALRPTWWCAEFEGQIRNALEVEQSGEKFYLEDDYDSNFKLTAGMGSPSYGHKSLPCACVIE
jgi:hypothetical protein